MEKVFLDTNIVLDLLDSERTYHQKARTLLKKLIYENTQITISEDMLSTIYYIIKDKKSVLEFFQTIYEEWEIIPFGKNTILKAIDLCLKNTCLDLEDTLQCLCAKEYGCNAIYTNDKKFVECGIKICFYENCSPL